MEHFKDDGALAFASGCQLSCEGIVSILARRDGPRVRLITRGGNTFSGRFPSVGMAVELLVRIMISALQLPRGF